MSQNKQGAPAWLFSFVDLAFLMLIAMTQMASDVGAEAPDLGEMVVPRIGAPATEDMQTGASKAWQVRVHPREIEDPIFELTLLGGDTPVSERFETAGELRERLEALEASGAERPLLAPHEESRSQDMLDAAGEIESLWPGRRRATVARTASTGSGS
jgi:hypothetical protein